MVKGIFFDLGQTLIYPPTAEDFFQILSEYGVEIELERIRESTYRADQHFFIHYPWTIEERIEKFFPWYIEVLLRSLKLDLWAPPIVEQMFKTSPPRNRWLLYEDTLPVLRELKERGFYLGIITNWILLGKTSWDKGAREVIEEVGIGEYMDRIVVSTEEGIKKPERPIFLRALQRSNLKKKEVLFVGDSYTEDIVGAREAGLAPILINRYPEWKKKRGDCPMIEDLWQLLPLLEKQ